MSCNRSAGTGENQIIWCGWAAAAGKRCGRAAGGLPASLRRSALRGAQGLPAPAPLPPSSGPLGFASRSVEGRPCLNRAGRAEAGGRRLRGAHPANCGPAGRCLPAPRRPTASRPRCRPARRLRGVRRRDQQSTWRGTRWGDSSKVVPARVFPPLPVPLSGLLPELLSRACGWRREAAPSRQRCRRACPAPAEPGARRPGYAPPRREGSRAPASLNGQHLPQPRVASRGGSDSELVPEPFSRPPDVRVGTAPLGKKPAQGRRLSAGPWESGHLCRPQPGGGCASFTKRDTIKQNAQ